MDDIYSNLCKEILHKIKLDENFQSVSNAWCALPDRSVPLINLNDEKECGEDGTCKYSTSGNKDSDACKHSSRLSITSNKLAAEICQTTDAETITNLIRNGTVDFGIDLFYGSVEQNLNVLVQLKEIALEETQRTGFIIPMSIYLKLSPRLPHTGGLKNNKPSFRLQPKGRIILTTNRNYGARSSHKVIYLNAKFLLFEIKRCDIICLGPIIQLQVAEITFDHMICNVLIPGVVTSRMPVTISRDIEYPNVSAEELEDITFAMGTGINVIVKSAPEHPEIYEHLRKVLKEFKCINYYLFTGLKLSHLESEDYCTWLAGAYDGFLIDCSGDVPADKIVQLSPLERQFMQNIFESRKIIYLFGSWSIYLHPSDYIFAFYYPDKYVLPCDPKFLHLFEAVFSRLAPVECTDSRFVDNSISGSTTLARSIACASFDFKADVIIICTINGQLAVKISHFRPLKPIIAVTSIRSCTNYETLHHNLSMLLFDSTIDKEVSHETEVYEKLMYGVKYAVYKKLVDNNSYIILVYRAVKKCAFIDKFVVFKFSEDYAKTIGAAVFKK